MKAQTTSLLIIGGGPGGYVAAIRAAQLGIDTTLVEGARLGGTCLNIGCIPSKALIHAGHEFQKARGYASGSALGIHVRQPELDITKTVSWKDGIVHRLTSGVAVLLKKHGVKVIHGWANIVDGKTVSITPADPKSPEGVVTLHCEHLLLATGSVPVELPFMPFGGRVVSSTEALSPASIPKRLVVVGGGYIGLELGSVYAKLGAQVDVVEAAERILPAYDNELTRPVAAALQKQGVSLHLQSSVLGLTQSGDAVRVRTANQTEIELPADQVLVAVGRRPCTQGWGLEKLMLDMDGRFVQVDDHCHTSMHNVWAIGDLSGDPMLAHRAMAQGEVVAEIIAGRQRTFEPAVIPAVCFTDPEVVVAGLGPDDAKQAGIDAVTALFPFVANSRSMTLESTDGFVRVVARKDNHRIVGWQAVGAGVSELSTAFSQSIEMQARLEDVAGTIHAHPTLGEAVQEAALRALGHALHI